MRPGCAGQTLTMEAVPQPGTCKKGAKFLFIFYGDGEGDGSRSSGDEARSFAARLIASCLSQESRTKSIHILINIQKISKTLYNLLTQEDLQCSALTWFVFQLRRSAQRSSTSRKSSTLYLPLQLAFLVVLSGRTPRAPHALLYLETLTTNCSRISHHEKLKSKLIQPRRIRAC